MLEDPVGTVTMMGPWARHDSGPGLQTAHSFLRLRNQTILKTFLLQKMLPREYLFESQVLLLTVLYSFQVYSAVIPNSIHHSVLVVLGLK